MRHLSTIIIFVAACVMAPLSFANLSYNKEHSEAMENLSAVESANLNLHYQCGKFSLFMTAFATQSDLTGRNASVTGKITGEKMSFDISEDLSSAISKADVLTGQISVACNSDKGAFRIEVMPNTYAKDGSGKLSFINIYADGTVSGIRSF